MRSSGQPTLFTWKTCIRGADIAPKLEIAGLSDKWETNSDGISGWKPKYIGATAQLLHHYKDGKRPGRAVDLYISYYRNQQQGSELINSQNVLIPESEIENEPESEPVWRNVRQDTFPVAFGPEKQTVNQNLIQSSSTKLLVWRWYWLGEEVTASPYMAKLILARNKLLRKGDDGAEIIIAAPYDEASDEAVPVLQSFVTDMMPLITSSLQNISGH